MVLQLLLVMYLIVGIQKQMEQVHVIHQAMILLVLRILHYMQYGNQFHVVLAIILMEEVEV